MLTFISGWRSPERDKAILKHRDQTRNAVFFIDDASHFNDLLPETPLLEIYRNGPMDFRITSECDTIIRVNYDTEHSLIQRAIAHTLLSGVDAQLVVTYDTHQQLYRLYPALRAASALLASDERLDAPNGDRVVFTRGGSFSWRDHVIETQTSLLSAEETLDAGIVHYEDEE